MAFVIPPLAVELAIWLAGITTLVTTVYMNKNKVEDIIDPNRLQT